MRCICTLCTAWERIAIKSGLMIGLTVCHPYSLNALVLIVAGQQTTVDGMQTGERDAR